MVRIGTGVPLYLKVINWTFTALEELGCNLYPFAVLASYMKLFFAWPTGKPSSKHV